MIIDSYQLLKKFLSEKKENKPTLLLHSCCAPCSSYVLEFLKEAFNITVYFYNPNIYPEEEYQKRLDEFKKLGNYKMIADNYEPQTYYQAIKGLEDISEGGARCFACYEIRLAKAAKLAKEKHFDYFTTTLSISPYKNSRKINEIGQMLANKYGVKFLYSDFKKEDGYKKSIILSKELGLYRQHYCGCIYSLQEQMARQNGNS